jgi:hypothetical protein
MKQKSHSVFISYWLDIFKFFLFYLPIYLYSVERLCLILIRKKQNSLKPLVCPHAFVVSFPINWGCKVLRFPSLLSHSISLKLWVAMLSTWWALWVLERSLGAWKFVFFDYGVWLRSWDLIKLTQLKWCLLMKRYVGNLFWNNYLLWIMKLALILCLWLLIKWFIGWEDPRIRSSPTPLYVSFENHWRQSL